MIVWKSQLTKSMVKGLDQDELETLIDTLNEVVAQACEDAGL